jgi:D-alanine-D-alanine ligase
MGKQVAVIYNKPHPSYYNASGEEKAAWGVLSAVEAVCPALTELGYDAFQVPLSSPQEEAEAKVMALKVDLVFNLFEGFCGQPETEALIPRLLSQCGLRYTGCPEAALRLALDKAKTKLSLKAASILTPDFQLLEPDTISDFHLAFPCIIKPGKEDASHGITAESVASDFASLEKRVEKTSRIYGGEALVEEFIDGPEFNATILGNGNNIALPISEIVYSLPPAMPRILTFAAKWEPDSPYFHGTRVICPAQVAPGDRERIIETALAAFHLVCHRGYGRVDMRQDRNGELQVIEVNPNPDISPDSGAVRQAKAAGMSYTQFIKRITELALEKN